MLRQVLSFALLAVAGCASQVMKGYVGQPIQAVMAERGPPAGAFDMPDGRRAFQWSLSRSYVMPTMATNIGQAYPIGNSVWWQQNTQISGGQRIGGTCIYTLFARWNDGANAWIIDGFQKPLRACE